MTCGTETVAQHSWGQSYNKGQEEVLFPKERLRTSDQLSAESQYSRERQRMSQIREKFVSGHKSPACQSNRTGQRATRWRIHGQGFLWKLVQSRQEACPGGSDSLDGCHVCGKSFNKN